MTQEELRRWQEEQERQRAQRQAERQAQEAQKQTEAATQQAEQQAAQAAQNAQTAQAKTTADPVYSSPEEKAQAQGMRRTIAEYSKGVQYKTLERGDHLPHGNVNQNVSDAIDKANKKGLVKIGQTNFGVQNEIKPDYKSIKNIKQAAFFGMAISENDREKYVKQYAESIGRDYDEVLGEMEGILGDAMFASPKSTAAKQRRMQSDNNAITNSFNAYGVTNYDGTPLNFNTASFNEIVNLIKTNPDAQTREDLTDLLTKATKQKGNRFYGRTFDASDTKKFLATADFNLEKYEGFVDSHLSGKFYRTPGHDEDNEKAYSKAMDWINMQNLSEYEKNYFRKAVDLEYKRQTGNGFTGTYEPGAEASDEPQEDDEDFNLIEWLTGLFKKDSKKSDVVPTASASPAEVAVPPEATEPTPTPVETASAPAETASAPMVEEILEGMDVPETASVPATSEAKVASTPVLPEDSESTEAEKPREVQGPKLPDNFPVKNISRGGIDMDALSAYYDIINGGDDVGRETGNADTEANAAKKKETIDSLSAFYDTVLKNTPTPQPKEKHGPPSPQNYIGSVDLSSQPEQALVYRMQGKESFLTEDTLNSLDSYINGSAGRMAAAGVLTPENLKKFAKVGADGKIEEEMGNMLATDIFSYNYGLLGDLSYYALKLQDPDFPAELLPSAVGTLFQTIDEAEQHARDDKDGLYNPALVNIYSQELELYPEKKAALDAAFGYEAELKEKAKEDARISAESEAKAKQERIDQAIAAFKTGDATQEDIDIVFELAPDLNDAQLLADKTYAQYKQDIALDRTFSDVEEGGWFNDQATAYLMRNGINAEPGSVAMGQAKDYVAGFLYDAVAKLAECAYALDYGSLEAYMNSTGLKWETVQEIALHDMRVFEKGLTPEVVEKAEELAAPSYQGKGLEGYQGFALGTAMTFEKGWADFISPKMKGWYDLASSTNLDVDSARARAYFTTNYGFARAKHKASEQILAMANDGYFPNESMNDFVKDYITKGGDPFALGIVPGDLGYVVEGYKKAIARSEYAQKWASRTMTPGQGKAFEVFASTVSNTSNQLLALALNVASPSTALINSMIAYGDGAYSEGFSYALDKGYGLRGGGLMGMSNVLSVALANMGTDAKILNKLKPASNAINLAAGNVPLPRMLNWMKAGALAAADTLADEVIKDELTEGIYSDALMAGAEEYIKSTDNLTKAPNLSTMAKSAKAAIFGVDVVGTASKVLKNAPENFIHMLPMALMTGGSASFKTWKSYDAVKTAMKTGDPSDYVKAQQTFSEDMKDPVKANEFDKAVDAADKAVRVAEAIQDGTGDIGVVMDEAIAVQEQADSHKEKLDASRAALNEATAQHENAIEAVIAGTADEETAQEAIDSAEAIAKNQTSVAEHQKEFDQKQGEADALFEQAVGIAEAEVGQQIMSEKVAQAEAENQPYGVDNPVPYNGGTFGMVNTNTGEYGEVVGIVGKDGAGFPVVKLNDGKVVSVEDMDWDQEVEDFSEIMEQFADVEDQLPLFEKDENGEWSQKPDFVPPVSDFSNMSKSKIAGMADLQTITLGEDGSVVSDTKAESSAESEADLTTGDGSALEEAEIDELPDLDSDNTYPYKHLDHEYSATMLVDGELESVSVLDMVGYTSTGGNPVFELSNGKYVTIDALSNVEGNLYDDALDAMFDAPDGSMLKFQPGQYVTFADLNAGEGTAEYTKTYVYSQPTELKLDSDFFGEGTITVKDVVGKTDLGTPIIELEDGTLVSSAVLSDEDLDDVNNAADFVKISLPVIADGDYLTVSGLKSKLAADKTSNSSAPTKLLAQEYEAELHGSIGSSDKVKVVDLVGVTEQGVPIVELDDGTKTTVHALKNAGLKKEVHQLAADNAGNLPVYSAGQYQTISDFKAKYGTKGKKTSKSAPIKLESWQDKKYHGAVNEPKIISTLSKAFKKWFNDPTLEKLLTNPDGTPKIFYRGFGGGMGSGTVYMKHESKPHHGNPVNFYTASLKMAKTYAPHGTPLIKTYNITNWETAKAAMENMGGKLIADNIKQGYQVVWKNGTKGKFYKENQISEFNAEYGGLKGAGIFQGYISVKKPLVLDAKGSAWTSIHATVLDKNGNAHTMTNTTDSWAHWAWDNGYDSVIIKDVKDNIFGNGNAEPGLEVITSQSSMFKSIYNTGKFDKNNPDIRYYEPGTFKLTGEPISQKMNDVMNVLSSGGKVDLDELYSIPEVQYAIENQKKGSSLQDFENDPEREIEQQRVLDELTALGSAEGILVDGKNKVVYTGDVRQERRMDIVIGPPAAGKSSVLVDPLSRMYGSRVVDSDMAKERLPEYEGGLNAGYLHKESSLINGRLLTESMARGDNIVLPIVGWDLDSVRKEIAMYKAAGYDVYLHLNQLPIDKAVGRMLGRLIEDGRYIDPVYPLNTVQNRPKAVFEVLKGENAANGYSEWSNDVARGEDPVLLYGDGKTERSVLDGKRALAHDAGRSGKNQSGTPQAGSAEGDARGAGQGTAEAEGDLKYLKSTQSNQGASSMPKGDVKKKKAKVNSPLRIAKKLADDIGTTIYGRKKLSDPHTLKPLPKSVKAYYSDMLDILGVRAKDSGKIVDMFHELTHAIGNKIKMEGTQRMIDALRDDFKANYSDAELPGEALAEFGWHYFFAPQEAEKIAGAKFVADFEAALKREGLYKAVKDAQEDLQLYRNQDVSGRSLAHVVDTPSKKKKNVFTTLLGEGVDETAYLRPIVNRLAQKFGWNGIATNMNPVLQARQAQVASILADNVFSNAVTDSNWKVVAKSFDDRVSSRIKTDKDANEFLAYILDKHALERSKQGKPVFDGVAISDGELRSNIKRIETEMPHIAEAANEMYEFWDDVMTNYMVDTGFMSEATWQYLKTMNPFYVPTMRDKGITSSTGTGGNKFTVKRATGSTEDIINPLISMRAMVEQMVKQVAYNNIALSVDRAYKAMPEALSDILIPVAKGESKAKPALTEADIKQIEANLKPGDDLMEAILTEMEKRIAFGQPAKSGEPGTMVVQHADGSTTEYKVLDPDMLAVITGAGEKGVNGAAQLIGNLTRTMAMLTTSASPIFGVLRNPTRDVGTSANYGSYSLTYVDGAVKWLKTLWDVAHNTDEVKQARATGIGSMSQFSARSADSARKFLNKALPGRKPTTKKEKFKAALGSAFDIATLQKFGEWIELTSRIVEAKYGKLNVNNANAEAGDFVRLGINQRDVTVDFYGSGKGQIVSDIACVSPFLKAAMNGIYRQARMYADPMERDRLPARLAKTVANTALTTALSSLALLRTLDDEEKEAYTEYLSQNLKTQHWYLPNPAYYLGESDKMLVRIPLPQDVASYAVHAAVTNAIWLGQEDTLAIEAGALAETLLGSLNPYNGTIFRPFIDAMRNRTWYDGYIVPRTMTDYTPVSAANQYTETTPELFKLAGKAFNISPMKLQYVIEQLGGYPAKILVPALSHDEFTGQLGGLEAIGEVWAKSMTSDPYVSQDMTSTFYDAKNLLTSIQNDAKEGKSILGLKAGLSQTQVDDAVLEAKSLLKGPIEEGQDAIKEMYDTVDSVNANQDLSSKQKNALIRDARKTCMEVLANVNAEMWAYQEQYCTGESLIGRFIKNYKTYSLSTK